MSYLGLSWEMSWRAHLHHIRVQLKSFSEQKSKGSDKSTQTDEARGIITGDALLEFAVFWWSWMVLQGGSC